MRTYPVTFPNGYTSNTHTHKWDQLTYAARGVITVHTSKGIWVVPPHRAVWVPAGIEHTEEMSGPVAARSLFLVPGISESLPRECGTVNVPPLLRELIIHASPLGALDTRIPRQARLIGVILDQLEELRTVPLQLPTPSDPRALKTAALLRENPGMPESLAQIARQVGASKRTIERLFRLETGMPFSQWRQRLRLIHALRLLGGGTAGDERGAGSRLRQHKRLHSNVQEDDRNHAQPLLRFLAGESCRGCVLRLTFPAAP